MDILKQLNNEQREAVIHKDGPILVLAGPGTGKTKVITHRVVHLIREYGVEPENILAVTFTNRAAQEMRDRISRRDMLGFEHAQDVWIDTFHAASVRILRENADDCGFNSDFNIFDQEIQEEILEECIHSLRLSTERYPIWMMRDVISYYKARCLDPSEVPAEKIRFRDDELFVEEDEKKEIYQRDVVNIIEQYKANLAKHDAFDFDDLIIETVKMLSDFPEVRKKYHNELRYILVDEYQDINTAQYHLLKLLCSDEKNVMVVADDDQAIYSWRGSSPAYIDNFRTEFEPKVIELQQHYRSSKTILEAAQALIENNTRRKTEKLITNRTEDYPVHHYIFEDVNSEIKHIKNIIKQIHSKLHRGHNEIAIFYRRHWLADKLETELRKEKIPVTRIQRKSSFAEGYTQNIMAYLNMLRWNLDRDVEKAINFPQRLLGRFTMTKLKWLARQNDLMLIELFENIDDYKEHFSSLTRHNIKNFVNELRDFKGQIDEDEIISSIASKLLDFINEHRSAYQDEELRLIQEEENINEQDNISKAVDMLRDAINKQQSITITANYGIDYFCAAYIISQTLEKYFEIDTQIKLLKEEETIKDFSQQRVDFVIGSFDKIDSETINPSTIIIGDIEESREFVSKFETEKNILVLNDSGEPPIVTSLIALKFCQRLFETLGEMSYSDVIVYDLETIGNNPEKAHILEIGATVLDENGERKESFNELVKPLIGIPRSSTSIHGITDEKVADKPSIEEVLPEFIHFIDDKILVGHNINEFDNKLIDREVRRYMDRGLVNESCDTLELARQIFPRESNNLVALAKKFNIDYKDAHRADADIEANRKIFKKLAKIDHHSCVMRSLSEFLPLIGISIIAKVSSDEIERPDSRPGAYYRAAVRYVQRNLENLPSIATVSDWLYENEKRHLEQNLRIMELAQLPQSEKDIAWQNLCSKFLTNIAKFESNAKERKLNNFLDYQKLITGVDEADIEKSVSMMTLHSAKGTEFSFVFMIGMEDGIFPMHKPDRSQEELEEERRLCYVGMTRAKERLYFTTVTHRNSSIERDVSLFIREIPEFIKLWRA